MPFGHFDNKRVTYSKEWKYAHQIADLVCKPLIKESLPTFLPRQKWLKRTPRPEVGQTVCILKDFTPRGLWPIGRISAINDIDTQQSRQYEVKTETGTFTIPGIRLAPIEAEERLHHDDDDDDSDEEHNPATGYFNKQNSRDSLCLNISTFHFLNVLNAADPPTRT